jgi:hypothetical protein
LGNFTSCILFGVAGSPCAYSEKPEYNILPAESGSLISLVPVAVLPPAAAPLPPLKIGDIVDPPLPLVVNTTTTAVPPNAPAVAEAPRSSALANVANMGLSLVAIMVLSFLFSMEY